MITILKEEKLFANVYDNYKGFLESFKVLSTKYPIRLWQLTKTLGSEFDLIISKEKDKLIACLNPKEKIEDESKEFIKCIKKEIHMSELF